MGRDLDIRDFGAVGDGKTLDTSAIQKAIDSCAAGGGGRVLCGGGSFLTGSLTLRSRVELHLAAGCKLLGSTDLADYQTLRAAGFRGENAPEGCANALLLAAEADDVALTGLGEIDGRGLAFYQTTEPNKKREKPPTARPRLVMFYACRGVRIEGVRFVDSSNWTIWLMKCRSVGVRGISIRGNRLMRNNDGIDLDSCQDVTVSDCLMDTEDDCVVLRAIDGMYDEPAACENVTVSNCVLRTGCQGIRIGCPSDGTIRRASFSNLTIESSNNGIIAENPHRYVRGAGQAEIHDMVFSNIVIACKRTPIMLRVEEGVSIRRLSDFSFSNLRIRSGLPLLIAGSSQTQIRNIRLSGVALETSGPDAITLRNCQAVTMDGVEVSNAPTL